MQKNAHKPLCISGSQHTSENHQKAKKDTIWYLFGAKFVFSISQIEWICLSKKTQIHVTFRVIRGFCTSHVTYRTSHSRHTSSKSRDPVIAPITVYWDLKIPPIFYENYEILHYFSASRFIPYNR